MKRQYSPTLATLLLSAALLSSCTGTVEEEEDNTEVLPTVTTIQVSPGFRRTFDVTGEVSAIKDVTIRAEFKADVESISVKPGDSIGQGQLLLTLDNDNVEQRYSTAGFSYTTANENVTRTRENGQRSVEAARINLDTAEQNLENILNQNKAKRLQAKETLDAAILNTDLSVNSATTNVETLIRSTATTVENALNDVDRILEFSPLRTDNNYLYETHIGVKDPIFKQSTRDSLQNVLNDVRVYQASYNSAISLLENTVIALNMARQTLENSITSSDYTTSDLNGHLSLVLGHQTSTENLIGSLRSAQNTVDSAKQNTGESSQIVINAQVQYDATIADLNALESSAQQQVEQAEASLQTAIASANIAETSARSGLASINSELQQARVEQSKLRIQSPFNGRVVSVPVKIGDEVDNGDILVRVEDPSGFKIVASVSAQEVSTIAVGDPVIIDETYSATITTISPSADPITKKYTVEIYIDTPELQAGAFVKLQFTSRATADDQTALFAPVTAVHVSAANTFVWLVTDSNSGAIVQKQSVEIGRLNGDQIEITSGIETGDILVIHGGRMLEKEGTRIEVQGAKPRPSRGSNLLTPAS